MSGWTYTTVIADVTEPVGTVANGESTELRWVPADEVDSLPLHPGFAQLAGVARAPGHLWPDPASVRHEVGAGDERVAVRFVTVGAGADGHHCRSSLPHSRMVMTSAPSWRWWRRWISTPAPRS